MRIKNSEKHIVLVFIFVAQVILLFVPYQCHNLEQNNSFLFVRKPIIHTIQLFLRAFKIGSFIKSTVFKKITTFCSGIILGACLFQSPSTTFSNLNLRISFFLQVGHKKITLLISIIFSYFYCNLEF